MQCPESLSMLGPKIEVHDGPESLLEDGADVIPQIWHACLGDSELGVNSFGGNVDTANNMQGTEIMQQGLAQLQEDGRIEGIEFIECEREVGGRIGRGGYCERRISGLFWKLFGF